MSGKNASPAAASAAAPSRPSRQAAVRRKRPRGPASALLILLAVVLVGIYIPRILPYDFWSDECYSLSLSHMGFREMLAATAGDNHPPLFYAVLMLMYRLFGDHGWAYGLAPLIPYAASLLLCATCVRKQFGVASAVCTMLCWAFMYNAVIYNVEIRMYSWAAFFVFASFCLLYVCLHGHSWPAHIALGLCAAMASYCHYYGFLTAGLMLFGLMVATIIQRKHVLKMVATCVCALIAYLPWLLVLLSSFERASGGFWLTHVPSLATCFRFVFQLGRGRLVALLLLLGFFALFGFSMYATRKSARPQGDDRSAALRTWLAIGMFAWLGTILVSFGLSHLVRPVLIVRYLYPAAPIAWIMLSVMAARMFDRPYAAWALVALVALVGVPSYVQGLSSNLDRYDLHEQTMRALEDEIEPGDEILTDTYALDWTVLSTYFPDNANTAFDAENPPELMPGTTYWLMLKSPSSLPEANRALAQQGYRAVDAGVEGIVVRYPVNLYRVERID